MLIHQADPKGLIRESYNIENITPEECRSIFVDWALSLPDLADEQSALQALIEHYALKEPAHPMSLVLRAGVSSTPPQAVRRGGRAGRFAAR